MVDKVNVENWPDATSGSAARVAYDLLEKIMTAERMTVRDVDDMKPNWKVADRNYILDLYSECHKAAKGFR